MSRRTSVRSSRDGASTSTVNTEVANLFKLQNKNQFSNALLTLRERYGDENIVNKIQEVFVQRHSAIVKAAKKFAAAVKVRYSQANIPFHQLLMKARAHARKHNLTEAEFAEFQRIYEQELAGANSSEVLIPVTNMMKVLGNITSGADNFFNVEEADYRNLQEILKLHEASKPLHAQALLQAIQYGGENAVPLEVTGATYDPNFHNKGDHVHPVIVALFGMKSNIIDNHFLYSNMAGIVKARYNRQPLTTRPDYELFYNLVTDPNDVVCDTRTPVGDLLHRCNLQNQLWNAVLHLRNGQVYNQSLREFMTSIDVCRLNKYDNPDLVYGRHDGTILKRLFSAFSFRPTTAVTLPISSIFAYNPYSQNLRPTVTAIPMINIRAAKGASMPLSFPSTRVDEGKYITSTVATERMDKPFTSSLEQILGFIEGNQFVNRVTKVMYSREVLVFYVDRRTFRYNIGNNPVNVTRLPTAIAGFEHINTDPMTIEQTIKVDDDTFQLLSVVCAKTNPNAGDKEISANYVIGSTTYLFNNKEFKLPPPEEEGTSRTPGAFIQAGGELSNDGVKYDPMAPITKEGNPFTSINDATKLITSTADNGPSTHGIIFIYKNFAHKESKVTAFL